MIHHRGGGALLLVGDALEVLAAAPERSVSCIVTSPPYFGLRDYGTPGQYGLEPTPAAYVETMRALFAEARRVLADDGTLWLNIGDSYSAGGQGEHGGSLGGGAPAHAPRRTRAQNVPPKNLLGMPWRTAFALQDDGWILRNAIVWHKPNAMPESVRDRMSKRYEEIFLFSKASKYWFDLDAVREQHAGKSLYQQDVARRKNHDPGKSHAPGQKRQGGHASGTRELHPQGANPGDVWSIATRPFPQAHFATFPIDLPLRCIKAGCRPDGIVLDPFSGAGTTGLAALQLGRQYIGIDLNPVYHDMAIERFATLAGAA